MLAFLGFGAFFLIVGLFLREIIDDYRTHSARVSKKNDDRLPEESEREAKLAAIEDLDFPEI